VILQDVFTVEPWNVRETHPDLDLLAQTESVFALTDGHVGWRANLDEGEPHGTPGPYSTGSASYGRCHAEEAYGLPETGQARGVPGRCRTPSATGRWLAAGSLDSHLGSRTHVAGPDRPGSEGVSVKEISIGEFARRSGLSLKALRLYDEREVLVPSHVDQASGYRYYDTAQLDQARRVVMLRQLLPAFTAYSRPRVPT
jgi:hypothetical protein